MCLRLRFAAGLSVSVFCLVVSVPGQVAPESAAKTEVTISLSPFEVKSENDEGYVASNTLAGSRLNSALQNTPAAITVFTKEFLDDIGALTTMDALKYSLNAGREFTDYTGLASSQQSDGAVQSRGFIGASLGRNYFVTRVSLDAFNTERIDFARGPNSILFGVGGPGGIINTASKRALIGSKNVTQLQLRFGSWDDYRASVDLNRGLGQKLAVRVNTVWQDREGWRDFEMFKLKGGALATTYRPFRSTEIRVEAEYVERQQVVPYPYPASDYSSPWIAAGKPTSSGAAVIGAAANGSRALVYDPLGSGLMAWTGTLQTNKGPNSPSFAQPPAFLNFGVIPREAYLGGPGNSSNNHYATYSTFLNQAVGPVNFELAFNELINAHLLRKAVDWNSMGAFGDPNLFYPSNPLPNGALPANAGKPNPNAGKFYVLGQPAKVDQRNDTRTWRITGSYQLDLTKRRLGKHDFAALATRETNSNTGDVLREVIINPPGTALYPLDVTNANNSVFRRNYLDFATDDLTRRGALEPTGYPITNINGISTGYRRLTDASTNTIT